MGENSLKPPEFGKILSNNYASSQFFAPSPKAPIKEEVSAYRKKKCGNGKFVKIEPKKNKINSTKLRDYTRQAFEREGFEEFLLQIDNAHSHVHRKATCDMMYTSIAAYNPIFYLHHSYIDYQWAFWQELQRIRGQNDKLKLYKDKKEVLQQSLHPFDYAKFNKNEKTFKNNRFEDTFDYQKTFCYQYDKLLFAGKTPEEFNQERDPSKKSKNFEKFIKKNRGPSSIFRKMSLGKKKDYRKGTCSPEVCALTNRRDGPLVKVFVGVVLPNDAPAGINKFDLCQGDKCVEADEIALFGSEENAVSSHDYSAGLGFPPIIDDTKYFLSETEVTAVLSQQGWNQLCKNLSFFLKTFLSQNREIKISDLKHSVIRN